MKATKRAIPKNIFRIFLTLVLTLGMTFVACEGPQGPTGPQGEQGTQGEQGPQGEEGPPGADGNANVIYSDWVDADWNYIDEAQRKIMRIPIDEIDYDDLRNNTLVMVYVTGYGDSTIYPLPGSGRWPADEILYSFGFGSNVSERRGLRIKIESLDGTDLEEIEYSAERGTRFRYILVPGSTGVNSSASNGYKPSIDLRNYGEVIDHFNIKD